MLLWYVAVLKNDWIVDSAIAPKTVRCATFVISIANDSVALWLYKQKTEDVRDSFLAFRLILTE